MNRIKFYTTIAVICTVFFGCDDLMEDMQQNDKAFNEELANGDAVAIRGLINTAQFNINELTTSWTYQVEQNLNADHFSGYMMSANPFGGGGHNAHYLMNDGWNNFVYSVADKTLQQVSQLKRDALPTYPDYYAYGLELKVLAALPMVDAFGTFPYSDYGTGINVKWDNLEEIYTSMVNEMTSVVDTLSLYTEGKPREALANRISSDVSSYNSDYVAFIKLANSIKLRLAIRMSNAAPEKAKAIAEEAVNNPYGVIDESVGNFSISTANYVHPLNTIAGWGDIQMGADMESFLAGYEDPRLAKYFTKTEDPAVIAEGYDYKGIRQGALFDAGVYTAYSKPNFERNAPMVLFTVAETYFLRAEGALKGWNMGSDPKSLYEAGVTASFQQHGVSGVEDYLQSSSTPMDYIDPKNEKFSFQATTDVTPKWDDAAGEEEQLEKIITQKWLALYPDGAEAWAEFRRTGYPKLKNIPSNLNTAISSGQFIKRLPIPTSFKNPSPTQYEAAISSYFGGNDNAAQPVWWDVTN